MNLRALFAWLLAAMTATAGAGYFLLWRDAQQQMRSLVQQARPVLLLRHGRVLPSWRGDEVIVHELSAEPAGEYKRLFGTPFGYRFTADELRLKRARAGAEGGLSLRFKGLRIPVLARKSAPLPDLGLLDQPLPTLSELGYSELDFEGALDLSYTQSSRLLRWKLSARSPGLAELYWEQGLEAESDDLLAGRFEAVKFQRLLLEWRDQGLLQRCKETLAARSRLSPEGYAKGLHLALDQRAQEQKWAWSAATAEAVFRFISTPEQATLRMEPFSSVELRNIGLYAPGDRFKLFGASLSLGAEHLSTAAVAGEPP